MVVSGAFAVNQQSQETHQGDHTKEPDDLIYTHEPYDDAQ